MYCLQTRSLYAGSDSGVVQSPTAFCSRYQSCFDCILARDPYCAWDHRTATCVNIFDAPRQSHRYLYIMYYNYFEFMGTIRLNSLMHLIVHKYGVEGT